MHAPPSAHIIDGIKQDQNATAHETRTPTPINSKPRSRWRRSIMRQTRAVACPATHNRDMTRWDRPSNQIGPARMLSCSLAIRGKPHPTLEQGSRVVWLNIRRTKYYLVAPLQRSATIDQPGTTCPRVTRISRRTIEKLRNQVTPTVSILIRSITCHNLIATLSLIHI